MLIPHRLALILALTTIGLAPVLAQDPFGDPGGADLFAGGALDAAPEKEEEEEVEPPGPLVMQLLEHSRRGHLQMAEAIGSLARIGRWSEADQLLSGVGRYPAAQQAEMALELGPVLFLRMKQSGQLSDASLGALDNMAAAAVAQAESPQRLRRAVADLGSNSIDAQLAAGRALLGGGNVAVAELVAAAVAGDPPAPRDQILRTILMMGDGGVAALRQLALYGTPPVRVRAVESLARISRRRHVVDLLTAAYAVDSSESERGVARANLQRLDSGASSRAAAVQILAIDFHNAQDRARLIDNDQQTTTLWSISQDRGSVAHQPTLALFAAYRDVVDGGARLRRLGGLPPELESEILAADMAYRVMVDPDWGDPEQIAAVRTAYPMTADGYAISDAIQASLGRDDHAASVGLIRLIDPEGASVLQRTLLLQGAGASVAPLVRAAQSPEPRVRYEAAIAAAKLSQGASYAGSSHIQQTLSEMYRLSDRPTAIVVETRTDYIIRLEAILISLGYRVVVVSDVRDLQRAVLLGGDLRLIVAKTELADRTAIEMIDMIRRLGRGRELPIAFYGAQSAGIASQRWPAPTVLIDRPASPAAFDGLLDAINRHRRLPPLTELDRNGYRTAATQLLGSDLEAR